MAKSGAEPAVGIPRITLRFIRASHLLETFHFAAQATFAISHGPTATLPTSISLRLRGGGTKNTAHQSTQKRTERDKG
jgi:hypothetical protein